MPAPLHSLHGLDNGERSTSIIGVPTVAPELLPPVDSRVFCISNAEIRQAPTSVSAMIHKRLAAVLQELREPMYSRNAILLEKAKINDHSTAHQDRDAFMAARVFDAFPDKLDPAMREPVIVASMVHDRQYIPAARNHAVEQLRRVEETMNTIELRNLNAIQGVFGQLFETRFKWKHFLQQLNALESRPLKEISTLWSDGSFPVGSINKKVLDPHAELGEEMMRDWYEDPILREYFAHWSQEQKEVAALSIRDHSNGSAFNPYSVPLAAQILRLVDKLDNTHERVPDYMLTASVLDDPNKHHQFVPTALRSMDIRIDRARKLFTVLYCVDTNEVEQLMQREVPNFMYEKEQFLSDFQHAYGAKSMRIAAEVTDKLFADEGEFYADDAVFQVQLLFADGEIVTYEYTRLVTSPNYA